MKQVSIIIPAYNEEESLPLLYDRLSKVISNLKNYEFELLFINDGSKDNTLKIIKGLREKDTRSTRANSRINKILGRGL